MMFSQDPAAWLRELFSNAGLSYNLAAFLSTGLLILTIILISWISNIIAKTSIRKVVTRIARRADKEWLTVLQNQKVFTRLSHFIPAIIIWIMAGWTLDESHIWLGFVRNLTYLYMLGVGMIVLLSFVESMYRIYENLPISNHRNIKGYVQLVKILIIIVILLIVVSVVFKKDMSAIIAGLGAMAAVLILVFKDILLSFVGSIQLSADNMVKVGDWITMPDRDLDGIVTDITLNTVKVQNFDKTIITVPTYALVKESFQNWAGMQEAGVRRIRRPIMIDMKSIRFVDDELKQRLSAIPELKSMIDKADMLMQKNRDKTADDVFFNYWKLTNLGVFRYYAEEYLRNHPLIDKNQTIILRHRDPEGNGLPLQVYAFANNISITPYENIQSEIFEHLFAIIGEFDLKIYQPTGEEILELTRNRKNK